MDTDTELSMAQARRIGVEAYIYLYPLVTMEITRRQLTQQAPAGEYVRGPMGAFHHTREFPAADFRAVVRPNFDTLYSSAWLDVGTEPMIVSVPAVNDRFLMLPCYDMWTNVFASPSTRTSGTEAMAFALTRPEWRGTLPDGVERIDAPTPTVWLIGRIQTNGPADYGPVRDLQDQLSITPLSSWGGRPPTPEAVNDPSVDAVTPPLDQVNALSATDFFALAADLLAVHPPHRTDWSQVTRIRRIGLGAGQPFELTKQSQLVQDALADVPQRARDELQHLFPRVAPVVNGWLHNTDTVGVYGNSYAKRAIVAMVGLGANQPEDAIYPVLQHDADGKHLDGSNTYVIHFDKDQLPPVDAFWSVTMYDEQGFQAANEINRFAVGDRDNLTYNRDGSLDIYIQHDSPGPEKQANWLPAPTGPLGITMRLYLPRPAVFAGTWTPPAVHRTG